MTAGSLHHFREWQRKARSQEKQERRETRREASARAAERRPGRRRTRPPPDHSGPQPIFAAGRKSNMRPKKTDSGLDPTEMQGVVPHPGARLARCAFLSCAAFCR
jgi:hypothetical protein